MKEKRKPTLPMAARAFIRRFEPMDWHWSRVAEGRRLYGITDTRKPDRCGHCGEEWPCRDWKIIAAFIEATSDAEVSA